MSLLGLYTKVIGAMHVLLAVGLVWLVLWLLAPALLGPAERRDLLLVSIPALLIAVAHGTHFGRESSGTVRNLSFSHPP